ncbi:MAG: elongation factor G [Deltaproteobacteria bacterium]
MLDPKTIRNIAVIAHDGAGKTALTEALLRHDAPARASKDGSTSHLDVDPEEVKRNFTVATHVTFAEHDGTLLNLLDAPGFSDFLTDADRSMAVCESGLLLVSAVSGVKHQTEAHWEMAAERSLPLLACVNKLDKDRASFLRALDDIEKTLKAKPVALQLPIGLGDSFSGVIDLITMRAHVYAKADGRFGGFKEEDIPEQLVAEASRLRTRLVEAVAETDDAMLEAYLDGREPSEAALVDGIAHAVLGRRFLPVLACAARPGIGVDDVSAALVRYLPPPTVRRDVKGKDAKNGEVVRPAQRDAPLTMIAFRNTVDHFVGRLTACRVYSGAVKHGSVITNPRTGHSETVQHVYRIDGNRTIEIPEAGAGEIVGFMKLKDVHVGDTLCAADAPPIRLDFIPEPRRVIAYALKIDREQEEKVGVALHRLLEEDPALEMVRDPETNETLLKGMGQVHIEVAVEKLKRKFEVDVHLELPHPAYHESITGKAKAQGKYKRQSGGRGQYGDCHIELEPLPRGTGIEFEDAIVGGVIPRNFIPSVEHGIRDAAKQGPLGGFPLVDFRARLVDGSFHTVDSSDMAFRIAGSMALKNALANAKPVLLEPMMRLEVVVPDEMLGEVIADLTSRRGKIFGMEPTSKGTLIHAQAPHAELRTYAPELRSLTKGLGYFTMELLGYEEVPTHEAQKVLAQRAAEQGKEEVKPNQPGKGKA